jgi:hypothetical protein
LIIYFIFFIFKETTKKSNESLRKLNDGITLIEQQTDENRRKIEKVLDAEIKSRLDMNYFIYLRTIH